MQTLAVVLIVAAAALYALLRWAPASVKRAVLGALARIATAAHVPASLTARLLPAASGGGCGSGCGACGSCGPADKAPGPTVSVVHVVGRHGASRDIG